MNKVANKSKIILVVDDDLEIRSMIKMILDYENYNVETASNGKDALEWIQKHGCPHLIFLDLMMPVMGGLDFLKIFKQLEKKEQCKVVVISAALNEVEEIKDYPVLIKPFEIGSLLKMVKESLA